MAGDAGEVPGFSVPVHRALSEPILLGGAPRALAIFNGTLAGAVGLGLRLWLVGLAFWAIERAVEPQITAIYRRFGLNDRQIEILARATPKRDYYCQSRRGNRLFELGLSQVALALCAAASKTDQAALSQIFAEHGRDGFLAAWLRQRGLSWAADLIPTLDNLEPRS